ncbi:MAG: diaminopimelate decarboxylase [Bradymonadaceae bacterium]|nr:diaminopimelate decarboxylase [Lujinxingiaceae bacterium]
MATQFNAPPASTILKHALGEGFLGEDAPWAVFYDLGMLESRFERLRAAFPESALHAVAVKAAPVTRILKALARQGAGFEAASKAEILLALAAGASPHKIVFDSPAKTRREIGRALDRGLYINADNLSELARIGELAGSFASGARVGIRVNPGVGAGRIAATSVATVDSKFGVSLDVQRDALFDAFRAYPWLTGLHVHTGSQGCGLELLTAGVRRAMDLAHEIDALLGQRRVRVIDIGGGLNVAYRPGDEAPDIATYAARLRQDVPELFGDDYQIITEFGRWMHAPCGFAASRVEYVKPGPNAAVATIHFGADLLTRHTYQPDIWHHEVDVHDAAGALQEGLREPVTIAGPLCFAADVVAKDAWLPPVSEGDIVVVRDVGAYTFGMWSRYCSRPFPPIFGYRLEAGQLRFEALHEGESPRDVAEFW